MKKQWHQISFDVLVRTNIHPTKRQKDQIMTTIAELLDSDTFYLKKFGNLRIEHHFVKNGIYNGKVDAE